MDGAALHETDVDMRSRIGEARQILQAALRGPQLEPHAVPCEDLLVAQPGEMVAAVDRPRAHHQRIRWSRLDEAECECEGENDQQRTGADGKPDLSTQCALESAQFADGITQGHAAL